MDNENHLPRWDAAEGVVMGCRVEGDFAHWHSWYRLVIADGRVELYVVGSQWVKMFG